ncbi:hypothetical protein V6N13_148593 [Hibiscus sabdariffa]
MEFLTHCSIGQCRHLISNSDLVSALRSENVIGVRVLRLSESSVLLIFDDVEVRSHVLERDVLWIWFDRVVKWSEAESAMLNRRVWVSVFGVPIHVWMSDTFEQLVSHWGSVIQVAEETVEPSSFDKGRVLIETKFLERIEKCVELCLESRVFPVRINEADTLLRGPRGCCTGLSQCSYLDSDHEPPVPEREDQDGEVSPAALIPSPPDVDVDTDLVTVPIVEKDMDEGLVFGAIGPDIEGSNVEIYNINGSQRKVRLLEDVIQSVQSPAEKRERVKGAKGR